MRNSLNLIVLLFFFITVSCSEKPSTNKEENNSKNNALDRLHDKDIEFQKLELKCFGEEYNAKQCGNEKEKISISFSKGSISFSIKGVNFHDYNSSGLDDLGYQTFLYGDRNNRVIIIDSFLESGHLFYIYFYDKTGMKFLGKKEITIIDESIILDKIKVNQIKNELIIFIGNGIEKLKFNIDKGIDLNTKEKVNIKNDV
ncbi:MAG: hypothetical protein ACN6OB_00630 [Chryseobacterium jejuense]|uniref:hypothetical protein n=1 Tax=Chryseobacterium jejuense TaxID=445960 RepID=UPI003D10D4DD